MQKQTTIIKEKDIVQKWYIVDVSLAPLGRIASNVSKVLTGKNKPTYTPNLDCGDFVIVINAEKAILTGAKLDKKLYKTQVSQQPGGLRVRTAKVMQDKYPIEMIEHAVKGMLPKGPLGRKMYKKLFVYTGSEHPHAGQKPEVLNLGRGE